MTTNDPAHPRQSTLRAKLNAIAHALAEADGYKIPTGTDFTERSDENGLGRYHRRARIAYEAFHGDAPVFDLLARTIPALSVAVDLADTDAHRASRRALLHEVEQTVGPDRVKALLTNEDAHRVPACLFLPSRHDRIDGKVASVVDNGDGTVTVTIRLGGPLRIHSINLGNCGDDR